MNRLNISPGYYCINAAGSVSNSASPNQNYCLFIQFGDSFRNQMVVEGAGTHTRSYIGSPSAWTPWTRTNWGPYSYVRSFSKSGRFDIYGCYRVQFSVDSGYHFGGIMQITTDGWIGSAYGYISGNNTVDIWISSGNTENGSISVYILFIKDYNG